MICEILERKEVTRSCGCCKDMATIVKCEDGSERTFRGAEHTLLVHIPVGERFVWMDGGKPERIVRQLLEIEI